MFNTTNMVKNEKTFLFLIIALAIALRFLFLHIPDVIHDESINGFRSLYYTDWLANPAQPTPYDWFRPVPWWTKLSFHDHPPLTFLLNWLSLKIFGPTPFAVRFFSALSGVLAVFLIYLIGKKLFGERVSLISAFILSINNFFVWLSRIGLQESILIAFILASFYYFILGLEKKKYLYLSALFFGVGALAKYTVVFLIPVYLLIFFFKDKKILTSKTLVLSFVIILILILPVIIYNLKLYQTRGHFDLQLSYFLGQKVNDWANLESKPHQSVLARFMDIAPSLFKFLSPVFLLTLLIAIIFLVYKLLRGKEQNCWLIVLPLIFITLLVGLTGPQERFLTLYLPFFALAIAIPWADLLLKNKFKKIFLLLFILFLSYEVFYSLNQLLLKPLGKETLYYSAYLHRNRSSWGFNQLDQYLNQELDNKKAALRFSYSNPTLEKIAENNVTRYEGEEMPALLIYDFNIEQGPVDWYLRRRELSQGFPLMTTDFFLKTLQEEGPNYYLDSGFNKFYFIQATDNTVLTAEKVRSNKAEILAQSLIKQDVEPIIIYNLYNEPSFRIFVF